MRNEYLTSEAIEQSFNHVYKKNFSLFYPYNASNYSDSILINASCILNNFEKRETKFTSPENKLFNSERPNELTNKLGELPIDNKNDITDESRMEGENINNLTSTIINDVSFVSNEACSPTLNTTKNLNETIIQSIRYPFSYEIKNRLLKRCGGLEYLKTKPTFTSSLANVPIIKENCKVFLESKGIFNITKEIGKGFYAVIYAIPNKTETYALKV